MDDKNSEDVMPEDIELTGEDNVSEPDITDIEDNSTTKIKQLQAKLKTCETEKSEHLENLQRERADLLNTKKRLSDEAAVAKERMLTHFVEDLLPLCDSFKMAMADQATWEAIDQNWRSGVEGIHAQLQSILKQHNVETFGVVGEDFDPNLHEAVGTKDDEAESETVLEVVQTGYRRNDTIIRPAKVIISN